MSVKLDNPRFTLRLEESYTLYDKNDHIHAYNSIKELKSRKGVDNRLTKDARIKIKHYRNILKTDYPVVRRFVIYFKKYKHKTSFSVEFIPRLHKLSELIDKNINEALRRYRREVLQVNVTEKLALKEYPVYMMGKHTKGWVYSKPGQIYIMYQKRQVRDLYTTKNPVEKFKYIGLELEFCAPIEELDLALKLWKAGVHKFAQMKKDGSLRPKQGETGYELALLLPESHYRKQVKQVCNILKEVGAKADERRCGLHVHLDMRRRKKDIVYNNLVACQNVFLTFLDPMRRNNEFCRMVESRKFPTKFSNSREERYKTVNAASYYKYRTLEVRMHEGCIDLKQITHWMDLLIKVANHKIRFKDNVNELTQLKKRIRIDSRMSEFFQDRTCYWQLQGPQRRPGFTVPRPDIVGIRRELGLEEMAVPSLVEETDDSEDDAVLG